MGIQHAQDVDAGNKSIFHHLFQATHSSTLATEICLNSFASGAAILPGNYRRAIRQQCAFFSPIGWTALHLLCNGSAAKLATKNIIKSLLDNDVIMLTDFGDRNDKVTFF